MGFLFTKLFWGILIAGFGVTLILEKVLHTNIHFWRYLIAFILIYAGIYLIFKPTTCKKVREPQKIVDAKVITNKDGKEYTAIFGNNIKDLSEISETPEPIELNTVFGNAQIWLSGDKTYEMEINTVFGSTNLPKTNTQTLHSEDHTTVTGIITTNRIILGDPDQSNKIQIRTNTVFGNLDVFIKDTATPQTDE